MDEGPYRSQDDLPKQVKTISDRVASLEFKDQARADQIVAFIHEFRAQKRSRLVTAISWLCASPIVLAFWYGMTLMQRSCDAHLVAERIDNAAATADEIRAGDRYCAALGLRYAGETLVEPKTTLTTTVCGNGHGDGMFVGLDGHLHALKVP